VWPALKARSTSSASRSSQTISACAVIHLAVSAVVVLGHRQVANADRIRWATAQQRRGLKIALL
jgi:hypothetical protein